MPGVLSGDRTGHGVADPTTAVRDADRISPPIGNVAYGLAVEVTFDLGVSVDVESPSHSIVKVREGQQTIIRFNQKEVPLDRDVVMNAFPLEAVNDLTPIASVVAHRKSGAEGQFALSIVPDLGGGQAKRGSKNEVVFVIDRSGSMGGSSMEEARTALRLCLRQLREGDRFAILAFDDRVEAFAPQMVPFTQATLQRADAWLASVDARGGTELLAPMMQSIDLARDGVIVVLTDGQVGNEDQILATFMDRRGGASSRVYSFGIGTNVSDALLRSLADRTGGAIEMIHPGERVDDKGRWE
jgi:Ca-activated chloride channel family protein